MLGKAAGEGSQENARERKRPEKDFWGLLDLPASQPWSLSALPVLCVCVTAGINKELRQIGMPDACIIIGDEDGYTSVPVVFVGAHILKTE